MQVLLYFPVGGSGQYMKNEANLTEKLRLISQFLSVLYIQSEKY